MTSKHVVADRVTITITWPCALTVISHVHNRFHSPEVPYPSIQHPKRVQSAMTQPHHCFIVDAGCINGKDDGRSDDMQMCKPLARGDEGESVDAGAGCNPITSSSQLPTLEVLSHHNLAPRVFSPEHRAMMACRVLDPAAHLKLQPCNLLLSHVSNDIADVLLRWCPVYTT